MRTSFEPVCGPLPRIARPRRAATQAHAPVRPTSASGLTFPVIPVVAPHIPAILEPAANMRTVAKLAEFLLHAGAIRRHAFPRNCVNLHDVCHSALNTWLADALGDLNCFSPSFELRLVEEAEYAPAPRRHRPGGGRCAEPFGVEISWKEASVCHWGIGAGLDYLEQSVPMLGSTILDRMERKGSHAYPLFTPGLALDEASYLYWRGEDDETLALDEDCGDNETERAAMAQDMVTRAAIEQAFPEWALD